VIGSKYAIPSISGTDFLGHLIFPQASINNFLNIILFINAFPINFYLHKASFAGQSQRRLTYAEARPTKPRSSLCDNMFDEIIDQGAAAIRWDSRISVAAGLLSIVIFTRLITSLRSRIALWQSGSEKIPPILPYSLPGLGNLLAFAFDTKNLLSIIM